MKDLISLIVFLISNNRFVIYDYGGITFHIDSV